MTIESFMTWQKAFMEKKLSRRKMSKAEEAAAKGKLTGRQLFLEDKTLNDSDVQFRQAGEERKRKLQTIICPVGENRDLSFHCFSILAGETVQVDESLFEDLDDLDLGDDDDDPDWEPGAAESD